MKTAEALEGACAFYEYKGIPVGKHTVNAANRAKLAGVLTSLYVDIFQRDPRISRRVIDANLSHGEENNGETTVLIPRDPKDPECRPLGFAILSRMELMKRKILYVSRALVPDYEARGFGEWFINQGIAMQTEEEAIDMVLLKTQNPASVWSMQKSDRVGFVYPFDRKYSANRDAQDVLIEGWRRVRRFTTVFDATVGLSQFELREEGMNLAYRPQTTHRPTMKILSRMVYEFGMNAQRGDVIYILGEVTKGPVEDSAVPSELSPAA